MQASAHPQFSAIIASSGDRSSAQWSRLLPALRSANICIGGRGSPIATGCSVNAPPVFGALPPGR
jgi:hypothetical protein